MGTTAKLMVLWQPTLWLILKKIGALGKLGMFCDWFRKSVVLKQIAAIADYSLHHVRNVMPLGFCKMFCQTTRFLFIGHRKRTILSCWSVESEVEGCVLFACPGWLIAIGDTQCVMEFMLCFWVINSSRFVDSSLWCMLFSLRLSLVYKLDCRVQCSCAYIMLLDGNGTCSEIDWQRLSKINSSSSLKGRGTYFIALHF